jgi:hypothetical protein
MGRGSRLPVFHGSLEESAELSLLQARGQLPQCAADEIGLRAAVKGKRSSVYVEEPELPINEEERLRHVFQDIPRVIGEVRI